MSSVEEAAEIKERVEMEETLPYQGQVAKIEDGLSKGSY
jgi:hypothetical protein